jgi:lysozyme
MTLHPRLSKAAIELVKSFEGLRRKAARLDSGGWVIGYGHTLSAREGAQVTAEEAEALLLYDLDKTARAVDALVVTALNANQFAAITAFAFNIGLENFKTSAVLLRLNKGAYLHATLALEQWRRAEVDGATPLVEGLVRRRAAERALFLTPPEGFKPISSPVLRAALDGDRKLGRPVDLWTPLEGVAATVERYAPAAATTEAIRNVTAHLQALFPDNDAEPPAAEAGLDVITPTVAPEPEPEVTAAPAAEPAVEPQPEYDPAPVVTPTIPAAPLVLEPAPAYEPEPAYEPAPPPPAAEEPAPPPSLFEPSRYAAPDYDDLPEGFRPRPVALDAAGESIFAPKVQTASPRLHAPVVVLVGLGGAALFVGSLFAMVYGKATLTNLVIGLLGVICMAPAGLKLLLKLFGERGPDQEA